MPTPLQKKHAIQIGMSLFSSSHGNHYSISFKSKCFIVDIYIKRVLVVAGGPSQINLAHKSSQHQRIFTAAQKLIFTSADKRNITQATQYTKYTGPTWLFSCCFLLPV